MRSLQIIIKLFYFYTCLVIIEASSDLKSAPKLIESKDFTLKFLTDIHSILLTELVYKLSHNCNTILNVETHTQLQTAGVQCFMTAIFND